MELIETLKKAFFKEPVNQKELSIEDTDSNIDQELTADNSVTAVTMAFFDNGPSNFFRNRNTEQANVITRQTNHIKECRRVAMIPEVSNAIEELVNEATFVVDNTDVVYLNFKDGVEMSDKLKERIQTVFDEIVDILNLEYNIDTMFKRFYIDGQLVIGLSYNNKQIKKGIQKANIMNPMNLYYDNNLKKWKYFANTNATTDYFLTDEEKKSAYDEEEIIRIDSGMYDGGVIVSHLSGAIKVANQLSTMEDLLIPLRFSRSMSRRVFNIDVGDLPYAKAMQAVKEIQDKFKYKRYYDVEKGTISNTNTMASIVEDYYFPNRSGGKGTTVDVLQETNNLGETGDIEYFKSKLYVALKVPLGRISGSDKGNLFDFTGSQIENDELKFFAFVNKLRQRFNVLFIEMLRRQLLSKGIIKQDEFEIIKNAISIKWEKENNFIERQNIELFKSRLELYESVKDYVGDLYSRKYVLKNVLKMSDEEIEQMKQEIQEEAQMKAPELEPDAMGDEGEEAEAPMEFGGNIGGEPTDDVEGEPAEETPEEEPETEESPLDIEEPRGTKK